MTGKQLQELFLKLTFKSEINTQQKAILCWINHHQPSAILSDRVMVDEMGEGNEEKFGAKWTDTTFIKFSSQLVIFNADIGVGKKVSTSLTRHKTQADAARNGTGWDRASFADRHTHKTCVMYVRDVWPNTHTCKFLLHKISNSTSGSICCCRL